MPLCWSVRVYNVWLRLLAGVQVDLINLLDLQMLQDNNEDDEGLEPTTLATCHDVRPEVDGQEGDKLDSELTVSVFSDFLFASSISISTVQLAMFL